MDIQRKLTSLGQKIVAVVMGAAMFVLLFNIPIQLVLSSGYYQILGSWNAVIFLFTLLFSALFSSLTTAYLAGKKGGVWFGVLFFLLITPFLILALLRTAMDAPVDDNKIKIIFITSLIFFPLGGWLGEKLYFRVHREADKI